jgi:hypothetical protein
MTNAAESIAFNRMLCGLRRKVLHAPIPQPKPLTENH